MKNKEVRVLDKNFIRNKIYKILKKDLFQVLSKETVDKIINFNINSGFDAFDVTMFLKTVQYGMLCEKCGKCCKNADPIIISDSEIPFYSQYFGNSFDKYIINKDGKWQLKKTKPCVFLMINNKCRIYNARPLVCRAYPFNYLEFKKITVEKGCKVLENIIVARTTVELIMKLIEKTKPELYKNIQNIQKEALEKYSFSQTNTVVEEVLKANEISNFITKKLNDKNETTNSKPLSK